MLMPNGETEAKASDTAMWIDSQVRKERWHGPPRGRKILRPLRSEALAGQRYQFLLGRTTIG